MEVEKLNSNSYICILFFDFFFGGGGLCSKIRTEKLLSKVFDHYVKLLYCFVFRWGFTSKQQYFSHITAVS